MWGVGGATERARGEATAVTEEGEEDNDGEEASAADVMVDMTTVWAWGKLE